MKVRVMIVLAALSGTALAGARDFVVEHAGFGATKDQAQPYLDKFIDYIQGVQKYPAPPKATFFDAPDTSVRPGCSR
jgi:hypothetical protein